MRFGSLFSGIGGFDLGLERAGWECAFQVEIDPFCRRVLARHWPAVARYGDIRALDLDRLERVELVCGGFPCQPVSLAGKGLAQRDARWLWPEFARVIRALRPRYILVENVPGLLGRGFGDVVGDLAACGYDAEWDCIPASALGAPHRRDRVWLVAYACGSGRQQESRGPYGDEGAHARGTAVHDHKPQRDGESGQPSTVADAERAEWRALPKGRHVAYGHDPGRQEAPGGTRAGGEVAAAELTGPQGRTGGRESGAGWTPSIFACLPEGFRGQWELEPDVGRVAHGVPARVDRLRGLGNAIVPQIAQWIGERLLATLR
jgi:DNA (cytosine-5)-methyltransferase 1